jgi:hypothetical protein
MHILEAYATSSGLKIDKPFILDKFFAVPAEKYITIHTGDGKFDSRTYDYWQDVVDFLNKFLYPEDVKIVQIGSSEDKTLQNLICLNGKTSVAQTAYVIKNSLCHVGIDSFPIHLASHYGRKIVGLYSNAPAENSAPYWSSSSDVILLESDKDGDKPTYSKSEIPKTINTIFPDVIASSVCRVLNLKFDYGYKMIFLGKQYKQTIIEYIPDTLTDLSEMNPLVVRMDLHFSEENLLPVFIKNKCVIVTDKPISASLLEANKEKIIKIVCRIKDGSMLGFVNLLSRMSVDFEIITRLEGENLNELKLNFLEGPEISADVSADQTDSAYPRSGGEWLNDKFWHGSEVIVKSEEILRKEDIKQLDGVDINKLFYLPNKFTLSKGKIFDSEYSWRIGRPIEKLSKKLTKMELNGGNEDIFWEEADFFSFLVKKNA